MTRLFRSLSTYWTATAVLSLCALAGCDNKGNGTDAGREVGGAGFEDVAEQLLEFECECIAQFDPQLDADTCVESIQDSTGIEEIAGCIDDGLLEVPQAREALNCLIDAQYDYLECVAAEGCAAAFTCSDGSTIVESWECDGVSDCADGSDEHSGCPAPFSCGDGSSVAAHNVCDGIPNCADGSDEPDTCAPNCDNTLEGANETCPALPEEFDAYISEHCFAENSTEPGPGSPAPACSSSDCDAPDATELMSLHAPTSRPPADIRPWLVHWRAR